MQRSAPLSSMGPADMVPCLEPSVTAPKVSREKRAKSSYKSHTNACHRKFGVASHQPREGTKRTPHIHTVNMAARTCPLGTKCPGTVLLTV